MTLESTGQFQLNLTERLSSQRPWIPRGFVKQTVGCRAAAGIGDLSEGKARPCCCRWERAPRAGLASLRSCLIPCLRQSHQEPAFIWTPSLHSEQLLEVQNLLRWLGEMPGEGLGTKLHSYKSAPLESTRLTPGSCLWGRQTQTDDAFKWGDTQHVGRRDRARLPLLSLPCSFMKADSGGAVRLRILHITSSWFRLSSELSRVPRVSGRHVKEEREAFKKYSGTRRAFHLASARSVSCLVWNWLSGAGRFDKSWAEGAATFSLFSAPGMQGAFHHQVILSHFQCTACILHFCYC